MTFQYGLDSMGFEHREDTLDLDDVSTGHPVALQELTDLRARCEKAENDAEMLNALLDMPQLEAQAVFWNYSNRKARLKAIDAAIAKERTS